VTSAIFVSTSTPLASASNSTEGAGGASAGQVIRWVASAVSQVVFAGKANSTSVTPFTAVPSVSAPSALTVEREFLMFADEVQETAEASFGSAVECWPNY
jgi:hypothetical protein